MTSTLISSPLTSRKKCLSPIISPKTHSKKVKIVFQSDSPSTSPKIPKKVAAQVPVFQLPLNDLSSIPEEAEIHRGFFVNMKLQPHQTRRFSGLMSISEPDKDAIEKTATTDVEYRSFSCKKTIPKTTPILARAA